jgi:hypothetical protein
LELSTDVTGSALFELTPRDFAVELMLRAQATEIDGTTLQGTWNGLLPVVPGAAWAVLEGKELVVRTPVARTTAYVDLVAAGKVIESLNLELQDQGGVSTARWPFTLRPGPDLFAVVSSEPDLQSMALVGWPLHPSAKRAQPTATWDARSSLVIDGVAQQRAKATASRQKLRRVTFGALGLGVLTEIVLLTPLLKRTKTPDALGSNPDRLWIWLLLGAIVLGLASLSLLAR